MQVFPLTLIALVKILPESPRFFIYNEREDEAKQSLKRIYGDDEYESKFNELKESNKREGSANVSYANMFTPSHDQFHPTVLTIMAQVNQALTGYGAVSVYGPQIFEVWICLFPTCTHDIDGYSCLVLVSKRPSISLRVTTCPT